MKVFNIFKFRLFVTTLLLDHIYCVISMQKTLREFCLYLQGANSLLMSQACEPAQAAVQEAGSRAPVEEPSARRRGQEGFLGKARVE